MRVAVIGSGIVGVTSAYFLAQNGHQVSVIERQGNVCEQASLGHAGLLGAGHLLPVAMPGMAKQIISYWFNSGSPLQFKPGMNLAQWRWLRSWMHECVLERMLSNKEKMQRLANYGLQLLGEITVTNKLDFQQRGGVLQLFRNPRDLENIHAGLDLLKSAEIAFQVLDEAGCRECEPALNQHMPVHGGVYFPNDGQGNSVLFAKQLKAIAQQIGVEFRFLTECQQISAHHNGVTLQLKSQQQSGSHVFDAVVLAAGADSVPFLGALGITQQVTTLRGLSCTANIKNPEDSPAVSVIDEARQIVMTRMDKRIRVAGTLRTDNGEANIRPRHWQLLRDTAHEWFPDAANYASATNWSGRQLMAPGSVPLLGLTNQPHVFINTAHAEHGWSMAIGAGKILADQISGQTCAIDVSGLTLTSQR